jgi:hypothetical protein
LQRAAGSQSAFFEPAFAGLSVCHRVLPAHFPFPIELLIRSCADYGIFRNKQKTYHRFFGTIFFGGVGSPLVVERQRLATEKIPKKRKNAKEYAKNFSSDPGFSAKEGLF